MNVLTSSVLLAEGDGWMDQECRVVPCLLPEFGGLVGWLVGQVHLISFIVRLSQKWIRTAEQQEYIHSRRERENSRASGLLAVVGERSIIIICSEEVCAFPRSFVPLLRRILSNPNKPNSRSVGLCKVYIHLERERKSFYYYSASATAYTSTGVPLCLSSWRVIGSSIIQPY